MKNFIARGDVLEITAGADIDAGEGVLVGSLFGVAATDIANGARGNINLGGVYDLPKVGSQAWTVGALVYWDNANDRCTTTAGSLKLIGVAAAAVGSGAGETTGRVRLNGSAVN
jgi:predicted RecA/RadA family phage recombinase